MDVEELIADLTLVLGPLGYTAEKIRAGIATQKLKSLKLAASNTRKNEALCKAAVGKEITVRTSKISTITGTVLTVEVDHTKRAFRVTILQSGKYKYGPYYVKELPAL